MTSIQYIEDILQDDWKQSISGRPLDVPQPTIVKENDITRRSYDVQRSDLLFVRDGGVADYEPKSFGWSQQGTESLVTLDIRTTGDESNNIDGRTRLWGELQNDRSSPRWGGLVGEATRVVQSYRKSSDQYDLIYVQNADDISQQMGAGMYRVSVQISLQVRASTIDTSV